MSSLNRTFLLLLAAMTFMLAAAEQVSKGTTEQSQKPKLQGSYCSYSYYGGYYCYYYYSGPDGG